MAKRRRTEEESDSESGSDDGLEDQAEGTIKLEISNLHLLDIVGQERKSSIQTIGHFPWQLEAMTECSPRTKNERYLSVYVICNPKLESSLWSCEAAVDVYLLSQKDSIPNFTCQFQNRFDFNNNSIGFEAFKKWTEVTNPDNGYIKGKSIVLEAVLNVKKMVGIRPSPTFDFMSTPSHCSSDVVLLVAGSHFHVNKGYLALHSPVFSSLFFGDFSEKDQKEVPLKDVDKDEFNELLQVLYPSHKPISAKNVEFLLKLGDRFDIKYILKQCSLFLMQTKEISTVKKLVWAEQHTMPQLQDSCFRSFKSVKDFDGLNSTDDYDKLSSATKAILLDKMLKIMSSKNTGHFGRNR